jgi:GntR family transcriptional regulator / MocR family aminotransferase
MDVLVTLTDTGRRGQQIYDQISAAIVEGRLSFGDALPPTRELALKLAVSRSTVVVAYERLMGEGYVGGRRGSAIRVCFEREDQARTRRAKASSLEPTAIWSNLSSVSANSGAGAKFDFQVGSPDASLFPHSEWRRLVMIALRQPEAQTADYGLPAGNAKLRHAVARHLGASRAVSCESHDIIITNGAQQAFTIIARALCDPGATVAIEDPGYPMARMAFAAQGLATAPVPVDVEGIIVDAIPNNARLVYVTPSHQFPTGVTMSLARRRVLLAWAAEHDAAIIEDDYDSEFRFAARPLEPLHRLDTSGRVIYVGTFSKVLLPSLRTGYLVAPRSIRSALLNAKFADDWHGPSANQAALAEFMTSGQLVRQIRRAKRVYQERRTILLKSLESVDHLTILPGAAGLHLGVRINGDAHTAERIVAKAAEADVRISSFGSFSGTCDKAAGLIFGYGCIEAEAIAEGIALTSAITKSELG